MTCHVVPFLGWGYELDFSDVPERPLSLEL